MNVIAMRAAAFIVGSMIAGCVYTAKNAPNEAGAASIAPVAVYPSAHETSGNRDGDSADVTLALPVASLRFRAVRYETSAAPAAIIAFYQHELAKLGKVSQERGGPHTKISGFRWVAGPGQTTLQAGRTIVGVKPLGSGTEFALIQIDPVGAPDR
jgi:hypothetical protein